MMKEQIQNTLVSHYGVAECTVHEFPDRKWMEVYCIGGNIEYILIALQQICKVDESSVTLISSTDKVFLFGVNFGL
jgi:hypothetical protein